MTNIQKNLKFLYQSTLIPTYMYTNEQCIYSYPHQNEITLPPLEYVSQLMLAEEDVTYLSTSFFAYYGAVKVQSNPRSVIIVGPVSQIPYLKDTLRIAKRAFVVSGQEEANFEVFLKRIPPMPLQQILNHLVTIHYFVNGQEMKYLDLLQLNLMKEINVKQTEQNYENKENFYFNNSYDIENQMCSYIENGNEKGLQHFMEQPFMVHEGMMAGDTIRQTKNTSIVAITLATRAAIRGQLDTEVAFQLSDLYLQQIELLSTPESIQNFMKEALFNFARRVQVARYNIDDFGGMQHLIQYIFHHVHQHLTVDLVAKHFGYSRTYLSSAFKKQVGKSLHQFIIECKLKEAQNLLAYTNKPISEISNYLCFSSQSHFQTVFKKIMHITPAQYRKQSQRGELLANSIHRCGIVEA